MKRFIFALLFCLVACSPAAITRTANGWRVASTETGGMVIGSSQDITAFTSSAPCQYRKVFAGEKRALECNTPNVVLIETRGQINVQALPSAPF